MTQRHIYLIRHGLTEWNAQKRWQGTIDIPLNEEGRRQAKLLGEYLKRQHQLDLIYSSDLSRAWETAAAIGKSFGLEPISDIRLRETNVGIFQGYTGFELDKLYPQEINAFRSGKLDFIIPNGESRLQVQGRAYDAFLDIIGKTTGSVALVSHGGWIGMLLRKLFKEIDAAGGVPITNTSITILEQLDDGWRLDGVSITPHL